MLSAASWHVPPKSLLKSLYEGLVIVWDCAEYFYLYIQVRLVDVEFSADCHFLLILLQRIPTFEFR